MRDSVPVYLLDGKVAMVPMGFLETAAGMAWLAHVNDMRAEAREANRPNRPQQWLPSLAPSDRSVCSRCGYSAIHGVSWPLVAGVPTCFICAPDGSAP